MAKQLDLDSMHFGDLVGVLQTADAVGVLLRGHLWIEALLEYATRGKLERPDAIDWAGSRFEHKIALAEAVDVIKPDLARSLRGFNKLRNRFAHEFVFEIQEDDVKTFIGYLDSKHRLHIQKVVDDQLHVLREIECAEANGAEIEIDPSFEWYPRVMTPTRARLFAFVVWAAREVALQGALEDMGKHGSSNPHEALRVLDSTLARLTGGLYSFNRAQEKSDPASAPS